MLWLLMNTTFATARGSGGQAGTAVREAFKPDRFWKPVRFEAPICCTKFVFCFLHPKSD